MTRTKTVAKGQDTKTKKSKTSTRIKVNTCLLLFLALIFGVLTYCGTSRIIMYFHGHQVFVASDRPGICFEEESNFENGRPTTVTGAYVCLMETNGNHERIRAKEPNDFAMYLDDRITFSAVIDSLEKAITLGIIGSMFTLSTLIGAIVYWNHNRGR